MTKFILFIFILESENSPREVEGLPLTHMAVQ